ncbi:VacJ family lipoprotein [Candidatus Sumerlaeota bacterium]|nr:VacJ family lipoprotein [Candidatus Sumerlaeota bacterium]
MINRQYIPAPAAIDVRLFAIMLALIAIVLLSGCSRAKPRVSMEAQAENAHFADDPLLAGLEGEFADEDGDSSETSIADPLQLWNRGWFVVNDKLYFWLFKPASKVYGFILYPRFVRVGISNFFDNLGFLRRCVNCLLQGQLRNSGKEVVRFVLNSTVGVLGLWDPATKWGLPQQEEDFDQTLGVWRIGMGCYLTWPLYGPSSPRGTIGLLLDAAMNPTTFVPGLGMLVVINETSLGDNPYEQLRNISLEPYIAVREAYVANLKKKIEDRGQKGSDAKQPAEDDDVWIDDEILDQYKPAATESDAP